MSTTKHQIESLLFVSGQPLTLKKLAEYTGVPLEDVQAALAELVEDYRRHDGGLQINRIGHSYQFSTSPAATKVVAKFLEDEEKKELTKPSLETLTIIAYRGPITKAELELIRGVNCSLILRNLLIRGLVEEEYDKTAMVTRYQVTFDFLQYLGLRETQELPDFTKLNANEHLAALLKDRTDGEETPQEETPAAPSGEVEIPVEVVEDDDEEDEDEEEEEDDDEEA